MRIIHRQKSTFLMSFGNGLKKLWFCSTKFGWLSQMLGSKNEGKKTLVDIKAFNHYSNKITASNLATTRRSADNNEKGWSSGKSVPKTSPFQSWMTTEGRAFLGRFHFMCSRMCITSRPINICFWMNLLKLDLKHWRKRGETRYFCNSVLNF